MTPTPNSVVTDEKMDARAFWETKRPVSHDEAEQSANRLINSFFGKEPHARVSIPANPERDDDLLILSYIKQQRALSQATGCERKMREALEAAKRFSEGMLKPATMPDGVSGIYGAASSYSPSHALIDQINEALSTPPTGCSGDK